MTIYTPQADKKPANDEEPEVVTEPLTGDKKAKEALAAGILDNQYNDGRAIILRAKRRSAFMHMLLALIILGVLALGAIGSIVLYRHLNKKVYTGRCGNEFYDPVFHEGLETSQAQARTSRSQILNDYVDEDITVCPEEKYEEIHTPAFDEVRETFIVHDFVSNYTAIIDHEARRCLVRTIRQDIVGPNAFVLQIEEKTPFGLRVSTTVVRQDAIIKTWNYPRPYGKRIAEACFRYDFFTLELYFHGMKKRSPTRRSQKAALGKPFGTYAVFTNNATHQTLYKIRVFEPVASVKPVALP